MRKRRSYAAALLAGLFACSLFLAPMTADARSSGRGGSVHVGGYSRSVSSVPKVSGNTGGYRSAPKAPQAPHLTLGGGKVSSAGGNTGGYKSRATQQKEQAVANQAKPKNVIEQGSSVVNHNYYGGGGWFSGGFMPFFGGMLFGTMLSTPWMVYSGGPGFFGGAAATPYYSPFAGIAGVFVWILEWAVCFGVLFLLYRGARRLWRKFKARHTPDNPYY